MAATEARERLIDEVKKYPVLYDTHNEHHRDIDVRDRCWVEIAARLGANSEVLKREWKILRDSLRQALKKSRGGATTKAGAPCKKWRFQARMAFLLPYMTRRPQRTSMKEEVELERFQSESNEAEEADADAQAEAGAGQGQGQGQGQGAGGGARQGQDAGLELFFASVCASARRLPGELQRDLKRRVLDALLAAEARADLKPPAPAPAPAPAPHCF